MNIEMRVFVNCLRKQDCIIRMFDNRLAGNNDLLGIYAPK